MIKTFILYYLNIKPTHGYEIQKFIQLNHMDSWTKIQSGSIYYALGKLEKEESIALLSEESFGAKARKIYRITEKGREELKVSLEEEIDQEIYEVGSDKFIIYPLLNGIQRDRLEALVKKHIQKLRKNLAEVEKWQKIKIGEKTLRIESLCFEMMISSLSYQLKWHETLLEELDECLLMSDQIMSLIQKVDFSVMDDVSEALQAHQQPDIDRLRKEILADPQKAEEKLEELISLLKSKN